VTGKLTFVNVTFVAKSLKFLVILMTICHRGIMKTIYAVVKKLRTEFKFDCLGYQAFVEDFMLQIGVGTDEYFLDDKPLPSQKGKQLRYVYCTTRVKSRMKNNKYIHIIS
jgi:hypothetical protein